MQERRKIWSFFVIGDGSWVWRVLYPDATEACADKSFPTFDECKADAETHGYVPIGAAAERRRTS
jgi:hypothetical protein